MRSGRLDRRITLQRKTVVENSYGEPIETWVDLATVWAEYLPTGGVERYAATQMVAEADTRWRIRYRADLAPSTGSVTREEYMTSPVWWKLDAVKGWKSIRKRGRSDERAWLVFV